MPIVWSLSILVGFFSVFSTLRSLTGLTGACASDAGALNVCNSITKFYWRNRPAGCAGFFVAAHGNSSSLLTERRQAQHGFVLQRLCAWRRRGHHRCCRWPRSLCRALAFGFHSRGPLGFARRQDRRAVALRSRPDKPAGGGRGRDSCLLDRVASPTYP